MADGRVDGQGERVPQEVRRRRRPHRDRQVGRIFAMSDDEVDYCFQFESARGEGVSSGITLDGTKRMGQFADRHKMPIGYHGTRRHRRDFETVFSYATYHRGESGSWTLHGRSEHLARTVHSSSITAGFTHVHVWEIGWAERWPERAVRRGRHAHQGSPAVDARQQVDVPGDDLSSIIPSRRAPTGWPNSRRAWRTVRAVLV